MRRTKYFLLSICLLLGIIYGSYGQITPDTITLYRFNEASLKRLSGPALDTISGSFFTRIGFLSIEYALEKDGTFRMVEYSCMDNYDLGKGRWRVKRKNKIELRFGQIRTRFMVYSFKELFFLVPPDSVKLFKEDFHKILSEYNEMKNGIPTSFSEAGLFITYSLSRTYFTYFPR
ncbi:MAG: hypothetical protein BGO54_12435 [Sphingobacteriales bacterium 46-32]|nr:MAG: hypothetical protein BGO54_12435 [Sphingobacteriales bacterium 46-32]